MCIYTVYLKARTVNLFQAGSIILCTSVCLVVSDIMTFECGSCTCTFGTSPQNPHAHVSGEVGLFKEVPNNERLQKEKSQSSKLEATSTRKEESTDTARVNTKSCSVTTFKCNFYYGICSTYTSLAVSHDSCEA